MTAERPDPILRRRWSHASAAVVVLIVGCLPVQSTAPTSPSQAPSFPSVSPTPLPGEATFALDGLTWQAVTQPFGGGGSQDVEKFFLNAFGELVAWGHDEDLEDPDSPTVPTFWSSGDGISWRETRLGSSGDNLIVVGVDHGPRGFVAVGFAGKGSSVATWSSRDAAQPVPAASDGGRPDEWPATSWSHALPGVHLATTPHRCPQYPRLTRLAATKCPGSASKRGYGEPSRSGTGRTRKSRHRCA